jgi:acyl carrier protein
MEKVIPEDLVKIIKSVVTDVDLSNLDIQAALSDQEVDSLDLMNIIFSFQEKYSVEISDESISRGEWRSVEIMVDTLNSILSSTEAT